VNDRPATKKGALSDLNVAGQQHGVGDHDPVADAAIVGHMATGHQKAVRTHFGRRAIPGRATDRHVFANHGARADPNACLRGAVEAQILWFATYDGKRMYHHTFTKLAVPADQCVGVNDAAGAQSRTVLNEGSRMDLHSRFGLR
jgi:hypothetical protein